MSLEPLPWCFCDPEGRGRSAESGEETGAGRWAGRDGRAVLGCKLRQKGIGPASWILARQLSQERASGCACSRPFRPPVLRAWGLVLTPAPAGFSLPFPDAPRGSSVVRSPLTGSQPCCGGALTTPSLQLALDMSKEGTKPGLQPKAQCTSAWSASSRLASPSLPPASFLACLQRSLSLSGGESGRGL